VKHILPTRIDCTGGRFVSGDGTAKGRDGLAGILTKRARRHARSNILRIYSAGVNYHSATDSPRLADKLSLNRVG
jgi:hypothetical protein